MDRLTGAFKGVSMFATAAESRIYNRLRQYEDTGLTPDEITALKADRDQWQDGTIIVKLADAEAEIDRLCAALKLAQARAADYEADIEAGRLVRLESCDDCRYKLQSLAWQFYTYPCNECRQRVKSNFARAEAARAALEGGQQ